MMEENKKNPKVIDLRVIAKKIWANKKLFYKVLPIVFIVSCIYIMGVPRYYSSEARLAPEMGYSINGGTLSSIASSFGFGINNVQSEDAISPILYPDLMEDNGFVTGLFNIRIVTMDGKVKSNYYDYLKKHQETSLWSYPMIWITKLFKSNKKSTTINQEKDPYILSEDDNNIADAVRSNIQFSLNEKNGVITIRTKAQDALVCKILADSVKERLQNFITEYRTNKAKIDYEYYKQLTIEAKRDYEKTRQRYGAFIDGNVNIALQSVRLKAEEMESEMEQKLNNYNTFNSQMLAAKAKIQERTPAFTLLKGASVPIRPTGPKRMLFVLSMLILSVIITIIVIVKDDLIRIIEVRD